VTPQDLEKDVPDLYDNPKYYEIAFSFRDIKAEVDVFEKCFKRFSYDRNRPFENKNQLEIFEILFLFSSKIR